MWVNDFNQTGVPQESSLLRNEGLTSSHGARTSFSSSSYVAQPARPLPAGVLSADLARPISVRELAQSRALAVPPLPPSATAAAAAAVSTPRPNDAIATTAGFAGFGIPTSCAVYAATSGVPMSQRCPTRTGVSDSMSLAYRNIDRLSGDDLYKYASHLQDASRQYSTHLQEAYAKRDQYRSEVAHLKQELQSRYLQIDGLRREQERTSEALLRVKEDNTQLREQLAEAEGRARNIQAKMSLLSGKDPSLAVHFYQSQLALKDAQLRELQQEYERASAAFSQRRSTSATGAASARPSINIPSEGAAAPESLPSRGPLNTGDVQDGDEAASVELRAKLEELQRLNTSLSQRLDEERAAHESALAEHTKASATAAADLTGLHDTIAQLRQQCTELRTSEDKLVAALTQRAPMSKSDYAALQASYSDLTADLAKAEARIAELQEKERRESQIAQQSQEELHNSLAAAIEERQTVQARNEQMQSLVHHLQRELELAEQANQLRQKQLDAAVSGNKGLADNLRIAQEQLLSEASEMEHLRNVRDNLEEQLNELRNRIDDLEREDPPQQQQQQQQPEQHQDTGVGAALGPTASSPGDSKATSDMCALENEVATLLSQRDALVRDRDDVIVELRQLQEQRLAFLKSPQPPVEEEEAVRQPNSWSATKIPIDLRENDDDDDEGGSRPKENFAELEEARQCIEHMNATMASMQSEHNRVEADLRTQIITLEAELESQSRALAEAKATSTAQQAHLEEIMKALGDELVATQAQEKELRLSEERHRELCVERQRAVEQLQAHVAELEKAARDAESQHATPVPTPAQTAAAESELSVMNAALESLADQLEDARQQVEQLSAEHARTTEELARATRTVADLEARAAEAESRHEATHAAAEGTAAELTARVTTLAAENAELRERLSTSRAAVTTFASHQTDVEGAVASLEERCASEAQRREAAEAEVLALRAALDRSAAELLELLQRSEDVQVALTQAVDRLTKEEVLVEELNSDAALHSAERAALADEMTKLQNSLERALLDKEEVLAQLLATQKDLDRAAAGLDAQYEEEERLRVVLEATTSAFSAQTMQVRLAMAHVVDMSKAFCGAVEAAAQGAVSPSEDGESVKKDAATPHCDALARTKGRQCMAARIEKVLSPWGRALDWVATMEQRLEALERGTTTSDTSDADSRPLSRRARRQSRGMAVEDEDVTEVGGSAQVLSASFMQRAVPRSRAEAAFARLIDEQVFATSTIADLRGALADKNVELSNLRSAMNTLASDAIAERDRADSLSAAIDDATEKLALAQAEFEEQLRQRMAATTAEVVEARRSEARAAAAQLSAEQQLAVVEDDLKEQQALVRTLQEENRRLARDVDRLRRSSRSLEVGLRGLSEVTGSVTPASLSPAAAVSPGVAARRFTRSASITEAVEQAQVLQVSSLQADLTRTRQQARELKGREATLQLSCAALEQEITALRPKAMDAEQLREDLAALRADYAELEQRHDQLERMTTAAGGGTMQELKQLRQQLRVREAELEEQKARSRDLMLSKAAPELEAVRRQEALRESLSDITTHLIATQAQYGVSSEDTGVTRSRCGSLTVSRRGSGPLISPASGPSATDVLTDRMKYLQALVHDREVELERAQAAQLESRAVMDTLKDQLVAKAAALERAEGLVAKYADTINTLTTTAMLESGARGGHLTTAPPLCNKADALNNPVSSSAAPPVNQLAPRTCAAVNNETHTTIALTSPAPLMPLFGEVVEGHRNSGTSHSAGTTGSSTDIAPLTANSQRAEASDDQMSARGRHVRRSSSSTKSAASTLSSHSGSARKLSTRGTRGRKRTRT